MRAANAKSLIHIVLLTMGMMTTFFAVRIQMKLVGLIVLLCVFSLLWIKNLDDPTLLRKNKHQFFLLIIVVMIAVFASCWLMLKDGPQPFTNTNHEPITTIEKRLK